MDFRYEMGERPKAKAKPKVGTKAQAERGILKPVVGGRKSASPSPSRTTTPPRSKSVSPKINARAVGFAAPVGTGATSAARAVSRPSTKVNVPAGAAKAFSRPSTSKRKLSTSRSPGFISPNSVGASPPSSRSPTPPTGLSAWHKARAYADTGVAAKRVKANVAAKPKPKVKTTGTATWVQGGRATEPPARPTTAVASVGMQDGAEVGLAAVFCDQARMVANKPPRRPSNEASASHLERIVASARGEPVTDLSASPSRASANKSPTIKRTTSSGSEDASASTRAGRAQLTALLQRVNTLERMVASQGNDDDADRASHDVEGSSRGRKRGIESSGGSRHNDSLLSRGSARSVGRDSSSNSSPSPNSSRNSSRSRNRHTDAKKGEGGSRRNDSLLSRGSARSVGSSSNSSPSPNSSRNSSRSRKRHADSKNRHRASTISSMMRRQNAARSREFLADPLQAMALNARSARQSYHRSAAGGSAERVASALSYAYNRSTVGHVREGDSGAGTSTVFTDGAASRKRPTFQAHSLRSGAKGGLGTTSRGPASLTPVREFHSGASEEGVRKNSSVGSRDGSSRSRRRQNSREAASERFSFPGGGRRDEERSSLSKSSKGASASGSLIRRSKDHSPASSDKRGSGPVSSSTEGRLRGVMDLMKDIDVVNSYTDSDAELNMTPRTAEATKRSLSEPVLDSATLGDLDDLLAGQDTRESRNSSKKNKRGSAPGRRGSGDSVGSVDKRPSTLPRGEPLVPAADYIRGGDAETGVPVPPELGHPAAAPTTVVPETDYKSAARGTMRVSFAHRLVERSDKSSLTASQRSSVRTASPEEEDDDARAALLGSGDPGSDLEADAELANKSGLDLRFQSLRPGSFRPVSRASRSTAGGEGANASVLQQRKSQRQSQRQSHSVNNAIEDIEKRLQALQTKVERDLSEGEKEGQTGLPPRTSTYDYPASVFAMGSLDPREWESAAPGANGIELGAPNRSRLDSTVIRAGMDELLIRATRAADGWDSEGDDGEVTEEEATMGEDFGKSPGSASVRRGEEGDHADDAAAPTGAAGGARFEALGLHHSWTPQQAFASLRASTSNGLGKSVRDLHAADAVGSLAAEAGILAPTALKGKLETVVIGDREAKQFIKKLSKDSKLSMDAGGGTSSSKMFRSKSRSKEDGAGQQEEEEEEEDGPRHSAKAYPQRDSSQEQDESRDEEVAWRRQVSVLLTNLLDQHKTLASHLGAHDRDLLARLRRLTVNDHHHHAAIPPEQQHPSRFKTSEEMHNHALSRLRRTLLGEAETGGKRSGAAAEVTSPAQKRQEVLHALALVLVGEEDLDSLGDSFLPPGGGSEVAESKDTLLASGVDEIGSGDAAEGKVQATAGAAADPAPALEPDDADLGEEAAHHWEASSEDSVRAVRPSVNANGNLATDFATTSRANYASRSPPFSSSWQLGTFVGLDPIPGKNPNSAAPGTSAQIEQPRLSLDLDQSQAVLRNSADALLRVSLNYAASRRPSLSVPGLPPLSLAPVALPVTTPPAAAPEDADNITSSANPRGSLARSAAAGAAWAGKIKANKGGSGRATALLKRRSSRDESGSTDLPADADKLPEDESAAAIRAAGGKVSPELSVALVELRKVVKMVMATNLHRRDSREARKLRLTVQEAAKRTEERLVKDLGLASTSSAPAADAPASGVPAGSSGGGAQPSDDSKEPPFLSDDPASFAVQQTESQVPFETKPEKWSQLAQRNRRDAELEAAQAEVARLKALLRKSSRQRRGSKNSAGTASASPDPATQSNSKTKAEEKLRRSSSMKPFSMAPRASFGLGQKAEVEAPLPLPPARSTMEEAILALGTEREQAGAAALVDRASILSDGDLEEAPPRPGSMNLAGPAPTAAADEKQTENPAEQEALERLQHSLGTVSFGMPLVAVGQPPDARTSLSDAYFEFEDESQTDEINGAPPPSTAIPAAAATREVPSGNKNRASEARLLDRRGSGGMPKAAQGRRSLSTTTASLLDDFVEKEAIEARLAAGRRGPSARRSLLEPRASLGAKTEPRRLQLGDANEENESKATEPRLAAGRRKLAARRSQEPRASLGANTEPRRVSVAGENEDAASELKMSLYGATPSPALSKNAASAGARDEKTRVSEKVMAPRPVGVSAGDEDAASELKMTFHEGTPSPGLNKNGAAADTLGEKNRTSEKIREPRPVSASAGDEDAASELKMTFHEGTPSPGLNKNGAAADTLGEKIRTSEKIMEPRPVGASAGDEDAASELKMTFHEGTPSPGLNKNGAAADTLGEKIRTSEKIMAPRPVGVSAGDEDAASELKMTLYEATPSPGLNKNGAAADTLGEKIRTSEKIMEPRPVDASAGDEDAASELKMTLYEATPSPGLNKNGAAAGAQGEKVQVSEKIMARRPVGVSAGDEDTASELKMTLYEATPSPGLNKNGAAVGAQGEKIRISEKIMEPRPVGASAGDEDAASELKMTHYEATPSPGLNKTRKDEGDDESQEEMRMTLVPDVTTSEYLGQRQSAGIPEINRGVGGGENVADTGRPAAAPRKAAGIQMRAHRLGNTMESSLQMHAHGLGNEMEGDHTGPPAVAEKKAAGQRIRMHAHSLGNDLEDGAPARPLQVHGHSPGNDLEARTSVFSPTPKSPFSPSPLQGHSVAAREDSLRTNSSGPGTGRVSDPEQQQTKMGSPPSPSASKQRLRFYAEPVGTDLGKPLRRLRSSVAAALHDGSDVDESLITGGEGGARPERTRDFRFESEHDFRGFFCPESFAESPRRLLPVAARLLPADVDSDGDAEAAREDVVSEEHEQQSSSCPSSPSWTSPAAPVQGLSAPFPSADGGGGATICASDKVEPGHDEVEFIGMENDEDSIGIMTPEEAEVERLRLLLEAPSSLEQRREAWSSCAVADRPLRSKKIRLVNDKRSMLLKRDTMIPTASASASAPKSSARLGGQPKGGDHGSFDEKNRDLEKGQSFPRSLRRYEHSLTTAPRRENASPLRRYERYESVLATAHREESRFGFARLR